jgi:hypothetical protein
MNNIQLADSLKINKDLVYKRMKEFKLSRTKKDIEYIMSNRKKPINTIELTDEQIQYIKNNYKTTKNPELAKALGLKDATLQKKMRELNIVRTKEEIKYVWSLRAKPNSKKLSLAGLKIEGGGKSIGGKTRWHRDKWITKNGDFSKTKKILVYKDEVGNFDDLILISKKKFAEHIRKRDKRKILFDKATEKKRIKDDKQKKEQIKAIASATVRNINIKKKLEKEEMEKKFEAIKASRPKTPQEAHNQLVDAGKVPIKLDHKTTVWVSKSKCELIDGIWVKKTPLNIVIQQEQESFKNKTFKHGKTKEAIAPTETVGEQNERVLDTNDAESN